MRDFEPLRETSENAFERALLRAADHDEPSSRAFARTAAALGVGASVLGAAGNSAAAAGTGVAATTLWTALVKPLLLGAVGGLVVAVSAHQLSTPGDTQRPPDVPASAPSIPARPASSSPLSALPASPTAPSSSAPETSRTAPSAAHRPASESARRAPETAAETPEPSAETPKEPPPAAPPAAASASIASEVATIDRARQALRDGRPSDALHELDVYRLTWPSGVLSTEAAVLRIEAHLALGDRTSGVRAARAFLSANPSGRYAARVRALFQSAELQ